MNSCIAKPHQRCTVFLSILDCRCSSVYQGRFQHTFPQCHSSWCGLLIPCWNCCLLVFCSSSPPSGNHPPNPSIHQLCQCASHTAARLNQQECITVDDDDNDDDNSVDGDEKISDKIIMP